MSNVGGGGGVGVDVGDESVGDGGCNKGRKGRKEAPLYWRVCVCVCVYTTSKHVNVNKMKQKAVDYECVFGVNHGKASGKETDEDDDEDDDDDKDETRWRG